MQVNVIEPASARCAVGPAATLRRRAQVQPHRTALVAGGEVWTYRRLATEAERLAGAMLARGVRPGDRVALHMANRPELAVAYYACFHVGAIAAPLGTRLKTAELRQLLRRLRPALYLGQADHFPKVAGIEPEILAADTCFVAGPGVPDGGARPWASLVAGDAAAPTQASPDPDAPAVLLLTSGTTGRPKLVVHTPATLAAIAASFAQLGLSGGQAALLASPMTHGSGLSALLGCAHFGASAALLERFDPDLALDAIEAHRCGWMLGLPVMWAELLRRQQERPRAVASLRHCVSVGDVCPPGLQEGFAAALGGVPLRSVLASSEIGWSLAFGLRPGPVSRVPPGTEVRVVNGAGAAVPHGEAGELLVRSAQVSPGCWSGPGQVEGAPEDGWCHTGDLVRQGEGDDLWFVGRKKDLIVRGGLNIAPPEVERVLLAHPAVRDAAVVGVPDAVLGQRVVGFVRLRAGVEPGAQARILAAATARLADYKVPKQLHVVDTMPRNAMGKLDRAAALDLLSGPASDEPALAR